ncbi:MAG: hypothetical protein ACM3VS_07135 [Candidatus Dadabacteria bacterium]
MKLTNLTQRWYTTNFISLSLKNHLEEHGYRILEEPEEKPSNCDEVIVASRIFGKEYIEIRGSLPSNEALKEETEGSRRLKIISDAMNWLSDLLLSPITFIANYYNDGKNRSLCLPDLEQYRELLQKLKEYFTTNNLNLKVYLVKNSGEVQIIHLNALARKQEEIDIEEFED